MTQTYNGNDVFKPFNAGLYGIDSDSEQSFQYEESKQNILSAFRSEFEEEITKVLAEAGLKYVGLKYWSPKFYNFATDSIDLTLEVVDEPLLLAALEKHREAIEKAMKENKSYDGYMALTATEWGDVYKDGSLDILAVTVLLSGIDFKDFAEYGFNEALEWEYQCEDCTLIHGDREYYSDDDQKKIDACPNK